jgi:hypothetical protein
MDPKRNIKYIGDYKQPYQSLRYITVSQSDSRYDNSMNDCGLNVTGWIPDSNSLLHSVALFLFGEMQRHEEVREHVIHHIRSHPELYKTIVYNESGVGVADYCFEMEQESEPGELVFIAVIAILYGITIKLFTLEDVDNPRILHVSTLASNLEERNRATLMLSVCENRYDLAFSASSNEYWSGIFLFIHS